MFTKILIANRGEIACRIIRTLKKMRIKSVAVYSEADSGTQHTLEADEAFLIGGSSPAESYLHSEKVLAIAKQTGAQAIHPGYGFLSENSDFAAKCEQNGIAFIGPTPENIIDFGLKHKARELAEKANVPLLQGSPLLKDLSEALIFADSIGYPVMLKTTGGGGGIGMGKCETPDALKQNFETIQKLGNTFFKNSAVFLEKYISKGRHIEVQIFGDGKGNVIALGERDCSIQRRNQKVIEETPSPFVQPELRKKLFEYAVQLGKSAGYCSAGTVEFLVDVETASPYFLEVNTRLQVEHGVTEMVYGIDLVEWMIRAAAKEDLKLEHFKSQPRGHSIQVRLYAEVPYKDFQPCSGLITEAEFHKGNNIRIDTWIEKGTELSTFYDPLIAKILTWSRSRSEALSLLTQTLSKSRIGGIESNLGYLKDICKSEEFSTGDYSTRFLETFLHTPCIVEVINPGIYSTIQDYPGRTGHWSIGVPPSGPMDSLAFRLANSIVGNSENISGLEMTVQGATLKFHSHALIALTGAAMNAELNGIIVPMWKAVYIPQGSILKIGGIKGSGCRTYLGVKYGFDVPQYLGSRSTFVLGKFGGHQGRPLMKGDFLPLDSATQSLSSSEFHNIPEPDKESLPVYSSHWEVGVLIGPHAAPDFLTEESLTEFLTTSWAVHYNSNRLGIRLVGPKPQWARKDGGEAGLHPSNIHDCEYAMGSINFSGDTPIILTCDGPSLGGFICPATIVKAELWKVGQIKPGDTIRFVMVNEEWALNAELEQDRVTSQKPADASLSLRSVSSWPRAAIASTLACAASPEQVLEKLRNAVIYERAGTNLTPCVQYRRAGDKYILIEYGPPVLDLAVRMRVYALMKHLEREPIDGILELSPGVRSLQVNYESKNIKQSVLIEKLVAIENLLPSIENMKIPTRIVYMPLSFEDESTLDAIERYKQSVRPTAPYLPSNIEFIRRINGLENIEDVKNIVFNANYLVLGLGDVYLGAPCAVPLDPRHRLVTSKYNPARTYTPEGVVGIGGVYMCIYGMDSPGGYQLVGRTVPIWNKFNRNTDFKKEHPWLLRFFDQVKFYPVSEQEMRTMRKDFAEGRFHLEIKEDVFDFKEYTKFLESVKSDVTDFQTRQKIAFNNELALWASEFVSSPAKTEDLTISEIHNTEHEQEPGNHVRATISGNIWNINVNIGDSVDVGTTLGTLEAMKMEFPLLSEAKGVVKKIQYRKGQSVTQGDLLFVVN